MLRDAKDDSGRFSSLLSSSGSPRVGFSRSSSRLSFQDDLDEGDFSCPFIVDDVDTSDSLAKYLSLLLSLYPYMYSSVPNLCRKLLFSVPFVFSIIIFSFYFLFLCVDIISLLSTLFVHLQIGV